MGTSKQTLKAYVQYDQHGRIVVSGNILSRTKPKSLGTWVELPTKPCCNSTTSTTTTEIPPLRLIMIFASLENASVVAGGDATHVSTWNTFFNLPVNGSPFTSISYYDGTITLYGGHDIHLSDYLFDDNAGNGQFLLSFIDANCITSVGVDVFGGHANYGCPNLLRVDLPRALSIGSYCFYGCDQIATINLSDCTDLGGTTGDDFVFTGISGNVILLTIPHALETDGDILHLKANNIVTVNYSD